MFTFYKARRAQVAITILTVPFKNDIFQNRYIREITRVASNCGFVSARCDVAQNVKLINFIIHKQLYAIMHKIDVICPNRNVATSK